MGTFSDNLLRIGLLSGKSFFTDLASDLSSFIAIIIGKVFMSCPTMRANSSLRRIRLAFMSKDRLKRFVVFKFIDSLGFIKRDG